MFNRDNIPFHPALADERLFFPLSRLNLAGLPYSVNLFQPNTNIITLSLHAVKAASNLPSAEPPEPSPSFEQFVQ